MGSVERCRWLAHRDRLTHRQSGNEKKSRVAMETTNSTRNFLLFAVSVFTLVVITTASSTVGQSKRTIDIQIPQNVPLKVKLKKDKEKEYQDLNNERWLRSLELEVTNTGDRNIYVLSLVWTLPDVKMPDGAYGSTFLYGRHEFITVPGTRPTPEDDPLEPGETHVFKMPENTGEGWEHYAKENDLHAKSVLVFFNFLGFGDGTGQQSANGQFFNIEKRTPEK